MALSYIGGKSKIGKWIKNYIPNDIETYIEPFGSMFWCFFSMDLKNFKNLKTVVYNDLNPLNYNLFRCLNDPEKLYEAMCKIPVQQVGVESTPNLMREQFYSFQKTIFAPEFQISEIDYDVAAKYVYVITQVFSGSKPETSSFIDLKGKYKSKYLSFRDKLKNNKWLSKFSKINVVKNGDFSDIISEFDSKSAYFYLDPPYWKTENYYSNHNFGILDHVRLSECLGLIEGKFSLSYYDFDDLNQYYPKENFRWASQIFSKPAAAKKNKKQNTAEEILIMNY